jgi:hypothetical protein
VGRGVVARCPASPALERRQQQPWYYLRGMLTEQRLGEYSGLTFETGATVVET